MTQIILQMTILRFGVRRFERRVNELLKKGWEPVDVRIASGWLHTVLYACLEQKTHGRNLP